MIECLKIGKQTPVFKGDVNIISNYYPPINVVNSIVKIIEKVVSARLTEYFINHFNIFAFNFFHKET